jgi:ATP-dependent protease HslVU (ClpYQ) peptidase subunit
MSMTCIVGIAKDNVVYIGGERGHSDSDIIVSSLAPKVFNKSHYLIGFAGNTGMGQSVAYTFEAPTHRINTDTYRYVYEFFIPALREHLKDQLPEKEDGHTSFLLGIRGKLFEIDTSDFQCTEYAEVAIGSGGAYAYGSLHTTSQYEAASPLYRIEQALNAAITYSPTCLGPVDIVSL